MVGLDILLSYVKEWWPAVEKVMDGAPLVIVDPRGMRDESMKKERVDVNDILHAARQLQGIPNLDQIEYAILEQSGGITIVKKKQLGRLVGGVGGIFSRIAFFVRCFVEIFSNLSNSPAITQRMG
jgi:uncharacterized membrane protein YcaP (DUF421 family)